VSDQQGVRAGADHTPAKQCQTLAVPPFHKQKGGDRSLLLNLYVSFQP
jgi:hypothetical protein